MKTLVIVEHDNSNLKPATLNTVTAAYAIGADIDLLVAGENIKDVADQAAKISGVSRVLIADDKAYGHQLAETVSQLIAELGKNYTHIFAPASNNFKNIMPRAAALLDVQQISEIISVESVDTFKRTMFAGNVIATVESADAIKLATVRTTAFEAAGCAEDGVIVENLPLLFDSEISRFIGEELSNSERPELTSARVVVSGGRGMQSGDNFKLLFDLADKLGGTVGASRAAVDAGYVPNDLQVGQTGKIVAPDLYIAAGISGAIQHLAGMKDSKVIVAINKDDEAPIFQVADYGLAADLFEAIPELERLL